MQTMLSQIGQRPGRGEYRVVSELRFGCIVAFNDLEMSGMNAPISRQYCSFIVKLPLCCPASCDVRRRQLTHQHTQKCEIHTSVTCLCRVLFDLIAALPEDVRSYVSAVAIDGTSATAMLVDGTNGRPLAPVKLYNEGQSSEAVQAAQASPSLQLMT